MIERQSAMDRSASWTSTRPLTFRAVFIRPRTSVTARPAQAYPLQGAALAAVWPRRGDPG